MFSKFVMVSVPEPNGILCGSNREADRNAAGRACVANGVDSRPTIHDVIPSTTVDDIVAAVTVSVSLTEEPRIFSKPEIVSEPAPIVFCAEVVARFDGHTAVEPL